MAHRLGVLLLGVFRRGSHRDVLPMLVLALAATALPEGRVQAVEEAQQKRPVSYRNDIAPLLSKAGCNTGACHGNASGKGGFRLSLRGDDPEFDFRSLTRDMLGRRVSTAAPDRSLALLKPTGQLPHEGGIRFPANSEQARALCDWIEAGANDDVAAAPRLSKLNVIPTERINTSATRTEQLRVTAEFADGSTRDVTRQACFDLSDPTLAEVSTAGLVQARKPCELAVTVRYQRGRGVSRIAFLPDRPGFVWSGPAPINAIDDHVFEKLRMLKINPSQPATDQVFLRRAYPRCPWPATRGRRGPSFPGRSRHQETCEADRRPARTPRVRGFLGPQVGRLATQ